MMQKVSAAFKKPKEDSKPEEIGAQANGKVNGTANGKRHSKASSYVGPEEDHSAKRNEVVATFEKYAQLIHASRRPLPTQTGDGTYLEHEPSSSLFQDLKALSFKDYATLLEVMKVRASGQLVDDKTMLMERIIQLVSGLPSHSKNRTELTNAFLDELWTSLPHPPLSYMGDEYQYRSADGSNNNPTLPWLGAANTAYARSIPPLIVQPGSLPDPGLIFDSIMARDKFKPHPNKVSSVFFAWASLIIHVGIDRENGRFTKPRPDLPPGEAKKAWAKYDNDLFQTGRLTNSTWCLDPRARMDKKDTTPSGLGNQCSIEFNLAYRWHSATSAKDELWTENVYKELFGKLASEVSMPELLTGLGKYMNNLDKDPSKRTFAHLQRQEDGTFRDEDLVNILTEAIEDVAGSFGPRNIPKALRAVEILGIQQARKWNCGSLNEFRKFFGLKPYDTFEEINSDPYIADQLRHLYEHPDYVELYPGIIAEEAKEPMVPGVGIAPTYTISRAVLSDAVALVRGDRFYTTDYNPKNLTNWGFNESNYDLSINQGCIFYKLALRAFPNYFKPNSIYAHYPMTIPSENKVIMKNLGRESHYCWDRPAFIQPRVNLTSYEAAKLILEDQKNFHVTWGEATGFLFGKGGFDFMLSGDTPFHTRQREIMDKALYRDQWHKQVKEFYEYITLKLLHEKSCQIAGVNQVDITRDVGNLAHVHFASNIFSLPLKTKEHPRGIFTEHEMYMIMAVIFTCIFFDLDPAKSFPLRQAARAVAQQLGKIIEANVKSVSATGFLSSFIDSFRRNDNALADYGIHMIRRLLDSGLSASEITWSQVLPTAVAMVPNQAQVFTQIIDYYLSDEGKVHLPEIHRLAKENTPESDDKLLHYAMEGIRLNGTFGSYRESQTNVTINDGGRQVNIKPGYKVFVSFVSAARDPNIFPNPNEVRLDRPLESYIHYGVGPHTCLGRDASRVALTAMLRVVGGLDNLRRAPGPQGQLKKIPRPGGFYIYMREDHGSYFVFPLTFKVHYDGQLPPLKGSSS
ncbi:Peroxidase [Rasamsonia emersonii CBS 393.64]|uniref:Peroxidase n=1 Tax=Rasamsonia emersonii (strain ATCC 16479 / CBS 393.64 / IMI 116815) TaxID=1408163 RepID=A0A0F4YZW3_RASE3|nr:Peroxidase [Rasamsonia emersonii CBS 393.64]KKA23635.1 Peroxidase [Rasamsonia emersonii CBS 393.64]